MVEIVTLTGIGWGVAALFAWVAEGSNSTWFIHPPPPSPPSWSFEESTTYECHWWKPTDHCSPRDASHAAHRQFEPSTESWQHARYCAMKNDTGCVLSHEVSANTPYGFFAYDPQLADLRFYAQPEMHVDGEPDVEIQVYEPTHTHTATVERMYQRVRIDHIDQHSMRIFSDWLGGEAAFCAQLLNLSSCGPSEVDGNP